MTTFLCARACVMRECALRRSLSHAASAMKPGARVRVLPSRRCLFDEPVRIKVDGLAPRQRVQLRARLVDDRGVGFTSAAAYEADGGGALDLGTARSLGGSYVGVEPMGLFWSMKADTPHTKLWKKDAQHPCAVDIEVFPAAGGERALATETIERAFMVEGARRRSVKVGRIRGTLFVPPGRGPFPGILDLYTLGGGLTEFRGSLLANKGFVVLCLAFYRYDDLPKAVEELDLEYFEEALTFLRSQPEVKGPGLGVVSISKSGDLALSIASFLPGIAATMCVNGCNANTVLPLRCKDVVIPPLKADPSKVFVTESGILTIRDAVSDPMAEGNEASLIPVERATCRFLLAVSEDDRNWNSYLYADQIVKQLKDHGKETCEVVKYPKAGHFLEVPYMPYYPSGLHAAVGQVVAFGGDPKVHAEAHVDLWRRMEAFFKKNLNHYEKSLL
ncbi:acyl-coenzyme A thioesterase 1-like [Scleropages formosus]|uniref:Acyl-coenzyme A thioesterase 1-like n=2 Tax=Scleropages formosus TaxID=113540 RepID=A0A8C9V339_SCLFO|nr:acyl-coenzyme A thioesterase 1-like [Scleropages formosus]